MLAPLNWPGDQEGARLPTTARSRTPTGFKDAYRQFVEDGWNGLAKSPEFGGQGLPQLVAARGRGDVERRRTWRSRSARCSRRARSRRSSSAAPTQQKATYLPKMVAGDWTGTMNLTEPQAGSDLARGAHAGGAAGRRHYRIYGQKIFITYGEHDFTENIIHLVLARTPDAPEGVKGISLFIVPKFLVNADGSARRAQRRALRLDRAQARHPREPDRACWPTATRAARSASWSARRTAASSTCSS